MVKFKYQKRMKIYTASTFVDAGLKLNQKSDRAAIIGGGDGGVQENVFLKVWLNRLVRA